MDREDVGETSRGRGLVPRLALVGGGSPCPSLESEEPPGARNQLLSSLVSLEADLSPEPPGGDPVL
jgi:hypothetical protein